MLTMTACGGNGTPAPEAGSTQAEAAPETEVSGDPEPAEDEDIAVGWRLQEKSCSRFIILKNNLTWCQNMKA